MISIHAARVTLATDNLALLVQFYQRLFGQVPCSEYRDVYVEFQLPGLCVGLFKIRNADRPEFASQIKSRMSLCLEVDNLEGAIAELTDLGYAPPGQIITTSYGREIYAYDPDGNRLILYQKERESSLT